MQTVDHEDLSEDTQRNAAREKVGTTLRGKWQLNRLIAVGGMGAVYDATHRNGMRGAVKVLAPFQSPAARRRFLREGRLANKVHHPGAVRVLDDDETEDGTAYLVMELLSGATLDALAARVGGKLEPAKAVAYGLQVADTLAEAHASGIVHRDIKPENLFLTDDGLVKVLDFGIAGSVARDGSTTLTKSGEMMGTPAFMAPEQARGRAELVDCQSDLYSLGASLFTLLTGKLVHECAGTVAEMLVLTITTASPSLRDAMPEAPDALVRAIDGALKPEKADRWTTAMAMRAALAEGYRALTGDEAPPPRLPSPDVGDAQAERARNMLQTLDRRRLPSLRWLVGFAILGVAGITIANITRTRTASAVVMNSPVVSKTSVQPLLLLEPRADVAVLPSSVVSKTNVQPLLPPSRAGVAAIPSSSPTVRRYDPIYDRRH